jgi:putative ABC transport system permease protein
MIKHFLAITWRNLVKNKVYSSINIFGLAIGLTSFIVILLYLNYELSYDTWDASLKKVYRISERTDEDILKVTPAPLANFLQSNSSQIEAATSIQPSGNYEYLIRAGDKRIYQKDVVIADSMFFKVFPYKIVNGNVAAVLNKPNAVVISTELSKKLFGNENPVGKTIKLSNVFENEITGVMELPNTPSHLGVQCVYRSPYEKRGMFWDNHSFQTYVKTKRPMSVEELERNINGIYYKERLKKNDQSLENFRKAGRQAGLFADAMQRIHNFPKYGNSNFATVSVLLVLAILLLVAGAINFSNLSIAASIRRAKEVGVRKVLGSSRKQLLLQLMSEIGLQCFISLCMAIFLVTSVLPYFNKLFDINLSFFQSGNALFISFQIAMCLLVVIILSGIYPSVFLSWSNTTKVLKGDYSRGRKGSRFRNALIVVQFTVSAFFIIGTLVIKKQMHFMQTKSKGFSGEQVMRINATQKTRDKEFDVMRNTLLSIPGVQYVSKTTTVPGDPETDTSTIAFKHAGKEYRMNSVKISTDYFKTLNVALKNGRLFDDRYPDQNTRSAIINEAAAKKLSLQNPVGAVINFPYCDSVPVEIIGVVNDFNVAGFENTVLPVVFTIGNKACRFQSGGAVLVKLNSNYIQQSVAAIEQDWKKIEPDFPIRYSFLNDNFQKLFISYVRLQKIINFFALAAIFISLIGLFALTAFLIGQRSKEIGIRKVLGAGFNDLASLLSKDFIKLVVIAVIIATPVGWWMVNKWLQTFAYRISISWWIFLLSALMILIVALITVGTQILKAAVSNPVKSLRTE